MRRHGYLSFNESLEVANKSTTPATTSVHAFMSTLGFFAEVSGCSRVDAVGQSPRDASWADTEMPAASKALRALPEQTRLT